MKTEKPSQTHIPKRVAIKPKHAKPYRKRHYALLLVMVAAAFVLFAVVISIRIRVADGGTDANDFVKSSFGKPAAVQQNVSSSYGFNFKYDPRRLYASAVDGSTGKLYIGYELANERPYQAIKLSTRAVPRVATDPDTISIDYYPSDDANNSLATIEQLHLAVKQDGGAMPSVVSTATLAVSGIHFQRTNWKLVSGGQLASQLTATFVSYTTVIDGKTVILRTNNRLGTVSDSSDIDAIAKSLSGGTPQVSYQPPSPQLSNKLAKSRSLLDHVLFSSASAQDALDTQTISALYVPAVVKIYNAYCTDISVKGQPYMSGACAGVSGSGFFVSANGIIATNGHVVTANPKDLVIENAYTAAAAGNGKLLVKLALLAGLDLNQLGTINDDATLLDTIFNAVYGMPDSDFTKSNDVQNLLVGLDSRDPDVSKLLIATNARKGYGNSGDIAQAKLLAANYRAADGVTKYRNSDVALIKIDGNNYPIVHLGDISEVSQGSSLSILGFPAAASDNGIVAKNVSDVTLTTGKVSAIKTANGDSRNLIETDTTIGHGNSGGPVFDGNGNVIGIATYTIDGGGQGAGTFNYVRDIQDLKDLASASGIHFTTISSTQLAWQKAITAFDSAHYSKSLKYFAEAKALYPVHPTVASFVSRAEHNVSVGKDVKDFPVGLIIGGAVAALVVAAGAIVLIVRHHAKHQVFKLASGQVVALPVNPQQGAAAGYYYPLLPQIADAETQPTPPARPSAHSLHR